MSLPSRCLTLLLCAGTVWAQPGSRPQSPGQLRTTGSKRQSKKGAAAPPPPPNPLLVDAMAFGPGGQPVRDLTAGEFAVTEHNQAQKVTSVIYVNAETGAVFPALPALALKPDQIHRTLVLVADDLGLSAGGAENVRSTLAQFVERQMTPRDGAGIVRTAAGQGTGQKITADRGALAEAIRNIRYNPAPGLDDVVHAAGALETLRQVLAGLRDVSGRKAVVLFSENPQLMEPAAPDSLIEAAHRASAVFSVIDVRGASAAPDASIPGLAALATETGGRFLSRAGDLSGALAGVLQDQQGYYLIGYQPPDAATDVFTGRPLPQRPVVTATRPGVQLRARIGQVNSDNFLTDAEGRQLWRPTFTTPAADLQRGLTNPFVSGAIPIRFVAVYSVTKAGPVVDGSLHIDAKDITFTRKLDGQTACTLDIQMAAF